MEHVKHYFECNPDATEVFETSNGFLFESTGMAEAHGSTLKDKEVKTHLKAALTEDGDEEILFDVTETDEGEEDDDKDVFKEKILKVLDQSTGLTEAPAFETPALQTTIFETPAQEEKVEVTEAVEEKTEVTEEKTELVAEVIEEEKAEVTEAVEEKTELVAEVPAAEVKPAGKGAAKAASKAQVYGK